MFIASYSPYDDSACMQISTHLIATENKAVICEFFLTGTCTKGVHCPFRHVRGEKTIVCKHWLRHLCKKGDDCEFLHEYDMSKMPICYFFQKFGECNNKDCQYLHIDSDSVKTRDCAWYDRGFCKHGEGSLLPTVSLFLCACLHVRACSLYKPRDLV